MNAFHDLLPGLEGAADRRPAPALVGFDGTIDRLYTVVEERNGTGEAYRAFPTLERFGDCVAAAAGRSACLEIAPKTTKIGGNGPIMAGALANAGVPVTLLGAFGDPLHPVFAELAEEVDLHSLAEPAVTHALEFNDGKLMLPVLRTYEEITAERLCQSVGMERLVELTRAARLFAPLNWSCLPFLPEIFSLFQEKILPQLPEDRDRLFFFDLADPARHSAESVAAMLRKIAGFSCFGKTFLGLNLSEAGQVAGALGLEAPENGEASLRAAAAAIRQALDLDLVMIHPTECAVAADRETEAFVEGPYEPNPLITTGAGDHLNAGCLFGHLTGMDLQQSLALGVLFSGFYVRTGKSPTLSALRYFIENDFQASDSDNP